MDCLRRIVDHRAGLKIMITYDPHWRRNYKPQPKGVSLAYLVEIVGDPGDVYAQGFGATVEAASRACLADGPPDWH